MSEVQVLHEEGLANHLGVESCAAAGNCVGEALTDREACAGWVLSLEIEQKLLGADVVLTHGRQNDIACYGEGCVGPAGSETPSMHRHILRGNRESLARFPSS